METGFPTVKYILHKHESDSDFFYHKHTDLSELNFVRQGSGSVTVEGRRYPVEEGSLIVFNQNAIHGEEYHASIATGKLERIIIGVQGVHLSGLGENILLPDNVSPIIQTDIPGQIDSCFQMLEREFLRGEEESAIVCAGILTALLGWVKRYMVIADPAGMNQEDTTFVLASQIQAYIKVHFCENITLQSLADRFYINQFYLAHLMKRHLGISPIKYIIQLRIVEAQNLLGSTDYPVKQIAQLVGYRNPQYFLNVFKRSTGMTPKAFRASTKSVNR